jgi:hypothetical protein
LYTVPWIAFAHFDRVARELEHLEDMVREAKKAARGARTAANVAVMGAETEIVKALKAAKLAEIRAKREAELRRVNDEAASVAKRAGEAAHTIYLIINAFLAASRNAARFAAVAAIQSVGTHSLKQAVYICPCVFPSWRALSYSRLLPQNLLSHSSCPPSRPSLALVRPRMHSAR